VAGLRRSAAFRREVAALLVIGSNAHACGRARSGMPIRAVCCTVRG
jgi:hypothetical protein